MPSTSLAAFTDFFVHTTGPAYLTPPDDIINDAQLQNYNVFANLGRSTRELQGGNNINDVILLDDPNTAAHYTPSEVATITNPQIASTISQPWTFTRAYVSYNEKEVMLNEGGGDTFKQYKRIRDLKLTGAYTSLWTKIERSLVTTPDATSMEGSGANVPMSLLASITSDGLAPAGFTTVMGQNPTSKSKWRNQTASYSAGPALLDPQYGLFAGFTVMASYVHFTTPPKNKEKFTASSLDKCTILTNREGWQNYSNACRANNDVFRAGAQDPSYSNPTYNGVEVQPCQVFDDQSSFTAGYPAYLWVNYDFFKVIFHTQKMFQVTDPMTRVDQPDTYTLFVDCWWNTFNRSRRRHGYLSGV